MYAWLSASVRGAIPGSPLALSFGAVAPAAGQGQGQGQG